MELLPHTATLLLKKCQKNTLLLNYLEKKFRLFLNRRLKFSLWVLNQKLETVKRHVEKKRVPRTFPTSETLKAQMARKKRNFFLLRIKPFAFQNHCLPLSNRVSIDVLFNIRNYELPNIAIRSLQQQLVESK